MTLYKFWFFFFKDFIHLFMRDTQRDRDTGREKQAPCRDVDVGLDRCSTTEPFRRPYTSFLISLTFNLVIFLILR